MNETIKNRNEVLEFAKEFLIAFIIVIIITLFIKPMIIKQSSMEPNFYENEYVLVSRQAYTLFGEEKRGDIVILKTTLIDSTNNKPKKLIKRIIGLPGDTLEIIDGYVYINDELLDEPYVKEPGMSGTYEKITLKENEYFLMGDNREVSLDSRSDSIGIVTKDEIYGRVVLRLLPISKFSTFKRIEY